MPEPFSLIEKILYIDLPFGTEEGAERDRSRFFWSSLSESFNADLLIINPYRDYDVRRYQGCDRMFYLHALKSAPKESKGFFRFDKKALAQYENILLERQYDVIFCRIPALAPLVWEAQRILPYLQVILDMDLPSSIRNRHLLETLSVSDRLEGNKSFEDLKSGERKVLSSPFYFTFANQPSLDYCLAEYPGILSSEKCWIYPSVMKAIPPVSIPMTETIKEKFILFTGDFEQIADQDALYFLLEEIYPRIEQALKAKEIKLYLAGENLEEILEAAYSQVEWPEIKMIREIRELQKLIPQSLFLVMPYRKGPVTRTSLMKAAAQKKTVVTTSQGAEGLDFSEDEIWVFDHAKKITESILNLIENLELPQKMGEAFFQKALSQYSTQVLSQKLTEQIRAIRMNRLKVAVQIGVSRNLSGGAWCDLTQWSRTLAEYFDVTVYSETEIPFPVESQSTGCLQWEKINKRSLFNIPSLTFLPGLKSSLKCHDYHLFHCIPGMADTLRASGKIAASLKIPCLLSDFSGNNGYSLETGAGVESLPVKYKKQLKHFHCVEVLLSASVKNLKQAGFQSCTGDWESYWASQFCLSSPAVEPEQRSGDFIFLLAASPMSWMGYSLAWEAFSQTAGQMPGSRLVILNTGSKTPMPIDKLMPVAINQIQVVDINNHDDWISWHRKADIRLIPFLGASGSLATLESWSFGLPVIQSDSLVPNRVMELVNGWTFESGSVKSLGLKMLDAYRQREKLPLMGKDGYEQVLKLGNTESLIKGFFHNAKSLISQIHKESV